MCICSHIACSICRDFGVRSLLQWQERSYCNVWSVVKFYVSLWTLASWSICNYSLDHILLEWDPLFVACCLLHISSGLLFCMSVYSYGSLYTEVGLQLLVDVGDHRPTLHHLVHARFAVIDLAIFFHRSGFIIVRSSLHPERLHCSLF